MTILDRIGSIVGSLTRGTVISEPVRIPVLLVVDSRSGISGTRIVRVTESRITHFSLRTTV